MKVLRHRNSYTRVHGVCKRKYFLQLIFSPKIPNIPMTVGSTMHAALAALAVAPEDEGAAFEAIYTYTKPLHEEVKDEIEAEALGLLANYLAHWSVEERIATKENELPFSFPVEGVEAPQSGMKDGLVTREGKVWLVERKTTGSTLSAFLKSFDLDRQTRLYAVDTIATVGEENFGGVILDVLQKANQRHGMACDRFSIKYDSFEKEKLRRLQVELPGILQEIERSWKCSDPIAGFPQSPDCCFVFGKCPFREACAESTIESLYLDYNLEVNESVEITKEELEWLVREI